MVKMNKKILAATKNDLLKNGLICDHNPELLALDAMLILEKK